MKLYNFASNFFGMPTTPVLVYWHFGAMHLSTSLSITNRCTYLQSESSNQHESEYDTASDSPSDDDDDLQSGEYDDDIHSSEDDDEDDLHSDAGEEQEGEEAADGEGEDGEKKKVDDDEDRSNPQYIPKKGTFYEHDDRTAENP